MPLALIGAGFGRTGTLSLKRAIETLGVGRCYHMAEVRQNPGHTDLWRDAFAGTVDWDGLFKGYQATVDWPGCYFWRELIAHYPDAKVLLSVRDPASWYRSVRATIYDALNRPEADPVAAARREMAAQIVLEGTFGGRFADETYAVQVFEDHNRAVRRAVPPDRLLVFEVAEGWAPLCRFLGREVPAEPFPAVNTTAEFRARAAERQRGIDTPS